MDKELKDARKGFEMPEGKTGLDKGKAKDLGLVEGTSKGGRGRGRKAKEKEMVANVKVDDNGGAIGGEKGFFGDNEEEA